MKVFERISARINVEFVAQLASVCKQWSPDRLKEGVAKNIELSDMSVVDTADGHLEIIGYAEDILKVQKMLEYYLISAKYGGDQDGFFWPCQAATVETQTEDFLEENREQITNSQKQIITDSKMYAVERVMDPEFLTAKIGELVKNQVSNDEDSTNMPNMISVEVQTDLWPKELFPELAELEGQELRSTSKSKRKRKLKISAKKVSQNVVTGNRPRGRPPKCTKMIKEETDVTVKEEPDAPDEGGNSFTGGSMKENAPDQIELEGQFSDIDDNSKGEQIQRSRSGRPVKSLSEDILGESGEENDDDTDDEPRSKRRRLRKGIPRKTTFGSVLKIKRRGRGRPRIHQPGMTYRCDQCDYTSRSYANLKNHEKRVHTVRQYQCEFCDKSFGLNGDLQRHIRSHTEISVCDVCGKHYKTPSQLVKHREKHDPNYVKPDPLPCEICGKMLMGKTSLRNHMEIIHKGKRKSFLCDTCGKSCPSRSALEDHENQHTGRRPYICSICGATFLQRSTLQSHHITHTDQRNFTCTTCGKAFRTKSSLKTHEPIHTGEKRFKCDQCGRGFHQKQALERHYRIHTGERPFKCELCGDKFNDASILKRHLMGIHKVTAPPGTPGRKVKRIPIDGNPISSNLNLPQPANLSLPQDNQPDLPQSQPQPPPIPPADSVESNSGSNPNYPQDLTSSSRDQPAFPGLIPGTSYPLYQGPQGGGGQQPHSHQLSHSSNPPITNAGHMPFFSTDHMSLPLNIPPGIRPPNVYHW